MFKKNTIRLFILAIGVSFLVSCVGSTLTTPQVTVPEDTPVATEALHPIESAPSDSSTPITTKMILSKLPRINETVYLTFVVSTVRDAPKTDVVITLPDDAVVVDGELEWVGDLRASEPKTLKLTIMFTTLGNKEIEGKALCPLETGDVWGDSAYIYFNITEDASSESFESEDSKISTDSEKDD